LIGRGSVRRASGAGLACYLGGQRRVPQVVGAAPLCLRSGRIHKARQRRERSAGAVNSGARENCRESYCDARSELAMHQPGGGRRLRCDPPSPHPPTAIAGSSAVRSLRSARVGFPANRHALPRILGWIRTVRGSRSPSLPRSEKLPLGGPG